MAEASMSAIRKDVCQEGLMGTKGCMFEEDQIEMGIRVGGSLQFPHKAKAGSMSLGSISALGFHALNVTFKKSHKHFSQVWGNLSCIYGQNSFIVDLRNLDIRKLQHFQKLRLEQGSCQFNHLAAMVASIGCDPLCERVAPIFSKKPQPSSKKDYSQAWETQHFYYPLTAKTASISLLNSRWSNQLGFDAFCGTFKKQNSCQGLRYKFINGDPLKHGNCWMARSYRRNVVQPIVAKASLSNIEYKCKRVQQTVITAMVAMAVIATNLTRQPKILRDIIMTLTMNTSEVEYKCVTTILTLIAKDLINQPKLKEILMIATVAMATNFPLGMCLEHSSFIPPWLTAFLTFLQDLPLIANLVLMPNTTIAYTLGATILGHVLGNMAERHRLKACPAKPPQYFKEYEALPYLLEIEYHLGHT